MRPILLALPLAAFAGPASAEERYFAYDPVNASARLMTRGVTIQAERGLFGGTRAERLFSTAGEGSAGLERDSLPGGVDAVLPADAEESNVYTLLPDGQGAALARVLCPRADRVWLVMGRVRPLRDLTIHAVGQGPGDEIRLCQTMEYRYRGEWARPAQAESPEQAAPRPPRG